MTVQTNAKLIRAFTDAMTHEDIEGVVNLWAPDGEWVIMATGERFADLIKSGSWQYNMSQHGRTKPARASYPSMSL